MWSGFVSLLSAILMQGHVGWSHWTEWAEWRMSWGLGSREESPPGGVERTDLGSAMNGACSQAPWSLHRSGDESDNSTFQEPHIPATQGCRQGVLEKGKDTPASGGDTGVHGRAFLADLENKSPK